MFYFIITLSWFYALEICNENIDFSLKYVWVSYIIDTDFYFGIIIINSYAYWSLLVLLLSNIIKFETLILLSIQNNFVDIYKIVCIYIDIVVFCI